MLIKTSEDKTQGNIEIIIIIIIMQGWKQNKGSGPLTGECDIQ
jgi:hypothetical protein